MNHNEYLNPETGKPFTDAELEQRAQEDAKREQQRHEFEAKYKNKPTPDDDIIDTQLKSENTQSETSAGASEKPQEDTLEKAAKEIDQQVQSARIGPAEVGVFSKAAPALMRIIGAIAHFVKRFLQNLFGMFSANEDQAQDEQTQDDAAKQDIDTALNNAFDQAKASLSPEDMEVFTPKDEKSSAMHKVGQFAGATTDQVKKSLQSLASGYMHGMKSPSTNGSMSPSNDETTAQAIKAAIEIVKHNLSTGELFNQAKTNLDYIESYLNSTDMDQDLAKLKHAFYDSISNLGLDVHTHDSITEYTINSILTGNPTNAQDLQTNFGLEPAQSQKIVEKAQQAISDNPKEMSNLYLRALVHQAQGNLKRQKENLDQNDEEDLSERRQFGMGIA